MQTPLTMTDYACWFCGEGIEETDAGAVLITVRNFWLWHSGAEGKGDPLQAVYAHSVCAKELMPGATIELDPSTFLEAD